MNINVRQALVAMRFLIVTTVLLGIGYPLLIWAVGQAMPTRATGSFLKDPAGQVVGSSLIGQAFKGNKWFWSRPSAAGTGYDPTASGGTNLAADNQTLITAIYTARKALATANGVSLSAVPADAVTSSGSGLDPDISPAYALLQVDRVARAHGLDPTRVRELVQAHIVGRTLGFIGEPHVNVLELNLALEQLK